MSISYKGNFIQGEFRIPTDANGEWTVKSPADLTDAVGVIRYSYRSVDEAVSAARMAFPAWKKTTFAERSKLLEKYKDQLKARQEDLARMMAREVGKPLWEAQQEVVTMINKVDISLKGTEKMIILSISL